MPRSLCESAKVKVEVEEERREGGKWKRGEGRGNRKEEKGAKKRRCWHTSDAGTICNTVDRREDLDWAAKMSARARTINCPLSSCTPLFPSPIPKFVLGSNEVVKGSIT